MTKRVLAIFLFLLIVALAFPFGFAQRRHPAPRPSRNKPMTSNQNSVLIPNRSPLVSFRILFMTGSASDPAGKEGLASLTAAMLADGGTRTKTYAEITDAMYPMATSFQWQVDKEMMVFSGTTHADNLEKYYSLVREMLLDPGFREEDFQRLREEAINYLKNSLRGGNDEELGKEVLYTMIYPTSHPYGHQNMGAVSALERMTIKDVRDFYQANYTRANIVIGLAGGYSVDFPKRVEADFAKLPVGAIDQLSPQFTQPRLDAGTKIEIVQRETRSTAISLGFPISVTRADKDWPALAVVASYFGQHRSSNSYLYQRLREARGLNYGDYAYIEYFPRGMFQFQPDPNLGRHLQIFQIWIRPVEPQNGHFVLRAALYEYDKLARDGMSQQAFESTREFLSKYVNVLTATQDDQLGYALDSRYYGIKDFPTYTREELAKLTLADVNRAIKQYLKSDAMRIAIVTKDAAGLRDAIISNKPSPITYNAAKPKEITDEDKIIGAFKIIVMPTNVNVVPVDEVFQGTQVQSKYTPVAKYDPKRDADQDIRDAIAEAKRTNRRILLEVGGEWCSWCHRLDEFFEANSGLTKLREQNFITVKINFSEENPNTAVLSRYDPIPGYPHIFVLDSDGKQLRSQGTSAFEEGKSYNLERLTVFLTNWGSAPKA